MFDIWQNIAEKGAVAVPLKTAALTPLGWAEIGEVYPDLLPDGCRNCDVYSDPQLIRESPFVNEKGRGICSQRPIQSVAEVLNVRYVVTS